MKNVGKLLAATLLTTAVPFANAGLLSSGCDNQTIIFTNTTGAPIYLVDKDHVTGRFDNLMTVGDYLPPHSEVTMNASSSRGSRGNAHSNWHFNKAEGDNVDRADLELQFTSGYTNYFSCTVTPTVNQNSKYLVTVHHLEKLTQVIFYPRAGSVNMSDYVS